MREEWLNGWSRQGSSVLIGSGVCCAGCGRVGGVICVVVQPDWECPEKEPDWPFEESDCPVCKSVETIPPLSTAEELSRLEWKIIREAVKIKKDGI